MVVFEQAESRRIQSPPHVVWRVPLYPLLSRRRSKGRPVGKALHQYRTVCSSYQESPAGSRRQSRHAVSLDGERNAATLEDVREDSISSYASGTSTGALWGTVPQMFPLAGVLVAREQRTCWPAPAHARDASGGSPSTGGSPASPPAWPRTPPRTRCAARTSPQNPYSWRGFPRTRGPSRS